MDTQLAKPRKPVNQAAKTSRNPRKNKWAALRAQSTRHKETQHNKPRQVPTDAHTHTPKICSADSAHLAKPQTCFVLEWTLTMLFSFFFSVWISPRLPCFFRHFSPVSACVCVYVEGYNFSVPLLVVYNIDIISPPFFFSESLTAHFFFRPHSASLSSRPPQSSPTSSR